MDSHRRNSTLHTEEIDTNVNPMGTDSSQPPLPIPYAVVDQGE